MRKITIKRIPKGSNVQLTANFNSSELDCQCDSPDCTDTLVCEDFIAKLQELRDLVGCSISINSGFRCEDRNKAIGGAPQSQHVAGSAVDIVIEGKTPDEVADLAEDMFDGIGRYDTWTHVDFRGNKARWDERTKK